LIDGRRFGGLADLGGEVAGKRLEVLEQHLLRLGDCPSFDSRLFYH
jgi:hypothetical protein